MRSDFEGSAYFRWCFALAFVFAGALVQMRPGFALPLPRTELAPPSMLLLVRDICDVRREGNREITRYCDDGYVCDRQQPGMCKPGPELQRQLEAERRRLEEELAQAQRELDAELRRLRADRRAMGPVFRTHGRPVDTSRAGNCSTISSRNWSGGGAPCQQPRRLSQNVYDLSRGAAPAYRPVVRRPPPQRLRPMLDAQVSAHNFGVMASYLLSTMARLEPRDPARLDLQRELEQRTRQYAERGVDTKAELDKVLLRLPNAPQADAAADAAATDSGVSAAGEIAAPETVAPSPAPEPAKPEVSARDEVLCSYLMTLEEGDASRLGMPVPDYCEPYLRSIGREPKDPNAPDPRRIAFELEDQYQIMMMKREYNEHFAPDLGQ